MKVAAGAIALFGILLTGARFATSPNLTSSSTGNESQYVDSEGPPDDMKCEAFANPVQERDSSRKGDITSLVQRYLNGVPQKTGPAPSSIPKDIKFMIVTVPDPLHTHLSLQFDRTLEALQQALQDEKYTYDSSWLPWKKMSSSSQSYADKAAEERDTARRELCPGLIVFRENPTTKDQSPTTRSGNQSYQSGIFAFVVAETPTAGLNQIQWKNTVSWIHSHANSNRADKALRILGPTFSGSMPSVVRALNNLEAHDSTFTSILLYSGRIRGCRSWEWLKSQFQPPSAKLPVRAEDFDENDAILIDRFYRFVQDRGHALSEVAVLSEDETAYGGLPDAVKKGAVATDALSPCEPPYSPNNRPVHMYYPRDISAIRSAYQEQSIFTTGSSLETASPPHTVLRPQYEPPTSTETDSIEPFSGQGMALTQEAQLYGIVNLLKTHGIRYIILRSTNSLDYLFLVRFLHRAYPTAYIVTMGSDMLFGREVDSTEFRGVLALSVFPLLPSGQDWTAQTANVPQHAHRVFGSDIMEGVYLAARFLESDDPVTTCEKPPYIHHPAKPDIPDYAPAFWMEDDLGKDTKSFQPVAWLSVIGRDGYWPLAVLTATYLGEDNPPGSNLASVTRPDDRGDRRAEIATFGFTLSNAWKLSCFLALLIICLHVAACQYGWRHQDLGLFVQFTPLPGNRQPALMALGWGIVCSLPLTMLLASARIYDWLRPFERVWVWITLASTLMGCVAGLLHMGYWRKKRGKTRDSNKTSSRPRFNSWIALALTLTGVTCLAGWLIFDYVHPDDIAVAYRSVHLASGVSPIVSLLIMLGGFYWWFWQTLCGLALLGRGRPILPRRGVLPTGLSRISSKMAANIENSAIPFPSFKGQSPLFYFLPVVVLVILVCMLKRPWEQDFDSVLHSLENLAFNWTLHGMFAVAFYLVMLDCAQLLATWLALKRLLLALNRLPLRRTFAAIQGLSMNSLWRFSGTTSRERYTIFSHQIESLIHLRNELDSFDSRDRGNGELRSAIRVAVGDAMDFIERRSRGLDMAMVNDAKALEVRRSLSRCTEKIIKHLLIGEWSEERESLDVTESPEDDKSKEHLALSEVPAVRLAEEFVCLVYVGYLQNMLARMRTVALSMAGLFAAITLSLAFYPFTPRPLLTLSLLLLLLVLGAVVAVVYAGLDRDRTLSHITNTEPGALGLNFWIRILSFAGVPVLGLIVAQFPGITDFVVSWIQPNMNAVK